MHWHKIKDAQALDEVIASSYQAPVLIFKHSFRCAISSTALGRLERNWDEKAEIPVKPYMVDVIGERPLSQLIAQKTGVVHESPQALLFKNGKVVYVEDHLGIQFGEMIKSLALS
jgi:bacillithiol system protein YtxJ